MRRPLFRFLYTRGPRIASRLRRWWVVFRHPLATIEFADSVYVGPGFSLHIPWRGTFRAGPHTEFRRNFRAEIEGEGVLEIGAGCVFTYDVVIQCTTRVQIGDRVMFGQSSLVVDGNHRFRDLDRPMVEQGYDYRPVRIADDVTVTTKCTIIADIGERAFVGANTVVAREVPAFCVVAGSPARIVEFFGDAGDEPPGGLAPEVRRTPAVHSGRSDPEAAAQASRKGGASSRV